MGAQSDLADIFVDTEKHDRLVTEARLNPKMYEDVREEARDHFQGEKLWGAVLVSDPSVPSGHSVVTDDYGEKREFCPSQGKLCPEGQCVARDVLDQ